jgi:methanogenic corrinoid protein MtbC1
MASERHRDLYQNYYQALLDLDKPACVRLALGALERGEIRLDDLYREVLATALVSMVEAEIGTDHGIWKEHARSEITRTVIECCYPAVERLAVEAQTARAATGAATSAGKVMIVLPAEEYHELGARMGADFFQIEGFETLFLGSNTPRDSIFSCIRAFRPDYVVIHVVNYYNLFRAKALVQLIQDQAPQVQLLVSGYAFVTDPEQVGLIGPVRLLRCFEDITALREGLL